MLAMRLEIKGLKQLQTAFKAEQAKQQKALNTAIKVEGYRLRKVLQQEIRQGAPGGKKFAPLSIIAKKRFGNRRTGPLSKLAVAVRYWVPERNPIEMHVGWTGPKISKSWKRIARWHQKGFAFPVTEELRRALRRRGARLPKRSKFRRYFFLRKTTMEFHVPPRPIIDPFWRTHEDEAWCNIRHNWKRKMRGERI